MACYMPLPNSRLFLLCLRSDLAGTLEPHVQSVPTFWPFSNLCRSFHWTSYDSHICILIRLCSHGPMWSVSPSMCQRSQVQSVGTRHLLFLLFCLVASAPSTLSRHNEHVEQQASLSFSSPNSHYTITILQPARVSWPWTWAAFPICRIIFLYDWIIVVTYLASFLSYFAPI